MPHKIRCLVCSTLSFLAIFSSNMLAQTMSTPSNSSFAHLWNTIDSIEQGKSSELSILYIGGSHVQAGWLGHGLRQALANWIPNAKSSRGLMLPYRMANTNTPTHFRTEFSGDWEGMRCTEKAYETEFLNSSFGTGLMVKPSGTGWFQHVSYAPDSSHHLTDHLTIWTNARREEWNWKGNGRLKRCEPLPQNAGWRLSFDEPADTVALSFSPSAAEWRQVEPLMYGGASSSVESDGPQYVVHEWGHNGLRIEHAAKENGLRALVDELQPDLIFIGVGINDAMRGGKFDAAEFQMTHTSLLDSLGGLAVVLLGNTPLQHEHKQARHHSITIDAILHDIAVREGCGFFSFTDALGGWSAWENCHAKGWLKSDGIHFTESGYLALSSMLFEAWQSAFRAQQP